jgi:hypothetical protein
LPLTNQFHDARHEITSSPELSMVYFHQGLFNMRKNQTQPPIPDRGISRVTPLNLPCGEDLNHLRIQLSDGLNLTAFLDHLATCEKCSQCQGKLIRELNKLIGGGE